MTNIIVLGAGMVGSAMAADLSKTHSVTLADLSVQRLEHVKVKYPKIGILQVDVCDKTFQIGFEEIILKLIKLGGIV